LRREIGRIRVASDVRFAGRINSDAAVYGGSGQGNLGALHTSQVAAHGHGQSLGMRLPPLAAVILTPDN